MLLGCVGNDDYGRKLKNELEKVDVRSVLETNQTTPTSRCGAAIYKKERCLIPQIMASRLLSEEFVNQNKVETVFKKSQLLQMWIFFSSKDISL